METESREEKTDDTTLCIAGGTEMKLDIMESLNLEAKSIMESKRERDAGYPKLRAEIEAFIQRSVPPESQQAARDAMLVWRKR